MKRNRIEYNRRWREKNRAEISAKQAAWYQANRARLLVRARERRRATLKACAEYASLWRKKNKGQWAAIVNRHHHDKHRATPDWADHKLIRMFYATAASITQDTGVPHHVDHIVPLHSKIVCGLHVEHNLQVLPAAMNRAKRNTWWPDMPQ